MDYLAEYKKKLMSPEAAAELAPEKGILVLGWGPSQPPAILKAFAEHARAGGIKDLVTYYMFSYPAAAPILSEDIIHIFHPRPTAGMSALDKKLLKQVGGNLKEESIWYVPSNLSEVPWLLENIIHPDIFVVTVSPMDRYGFFSLGPWHGYNLPAARSSKKILIEVNENTPRVHGQAFLHVSEVDAIVENSVPLPEIPFPHKPEDEAIARFVIEQIPDGANIQLGVGSSPNDIARFLVNHKDLGIHTELVTPAMVDLVKKGVVTGRKKNIQPDKHVFTVCYGSKETYDFLDDNASFEGYPSNYVNNPFLLAKIENLISINSILQIDLFGQCNADFIGGQQFAGVGGQNDFVRGAFASPGGKSFIVFPSTADDGKTSRIVPIIENIATDSRTDVNFVVTEYGMVNLKGKSTRERALALIDLAHPEFREKLLNAAVKMRVVGGQD